MSSARERVRRYPVWEVARVLGRDTDALRRQLARVGWATQDLPFPRSPWSVPEAIMAAHFSAVKKKLDALRTAGTRLSNRGQWRRRKNGDNSTGDNAMSSRNRGPGKPQRKGRGVLGVET